MSWLENLKVDDKIGVKVSHPGSGDIYYIGTVVKLTKTKVEVSLLGHTSTFSLPHGKTKMSGKWDFPDQLVELTPDVLDLVARRRLASALEKRLSAVRVKEFTLEQMQSLNSFLDTLAPKD